ncbi:calcium-binding protein [Massilia sp. ST3]|uniref:calcium-binding protein n=1 Tax=Massilia sp. ST3 TaxID=2824903 RepID=UPI001B823EB2|nr:calcium-binding protein [Massilia sp. ST3]MBQ5945937.1 hypothetical protein [Massilia sp. ST3]
MSLTEQQRISYTKTIGKIYVELLGRPVDAAGLAAGLALYEEWGEESTAGMVAYEVWKSPEFARMYGSMLGGDAQDVDKIYHTMFGRAPSAQETAYCIERLDTVYWLGNLISELSAGATGTDAAVLSNKVAAAEAFSAAIDTAPEKKAYAGWEALDLGKAYLSRVTDAASLAKALATVGSTVKSLLAIRPDTPPSASISLYGTPELGKMMYSYSTHHDIDGGGALSFQWFANGNAIPGAQGWTLYIDHLLAGYDISVQMTMTDARGYTTVLASDTIGPGNNTINGTSGADRLAGGAGDDHYRVNHAEDAIVENEGEGIDHADVDFASAGTYILAPHVENTTIVAVGNHVVNVIGNALDNRMLGNGAVNTLTGGAGDDFLDGKGGKDTLAGGAGNDLYVTDLAADTVIEDENQGIDTVETTSVSYALTANVENLRYVGDKAFTGTGNGEANDIAGSDGGDKLAGLAGADVLRGGKGDDSLDGGAGNDVLQGGSGNDTLLGGDGNDELIAGGGSDVADGGSGEDTLLVTGAFTDYTRSRPSAGDMVLVHKLTKETLTVRNVEHVIFNDTTKTIDALRDNVASSGNDVLTGTDGDDLLDGGQGADAMSGGLGDDRYVLDVVGDTVTEQEDAGIDRVDVAFASAGTYVLGDHVEHATVTASSKIAVNLTGNGLANTLVGNAAANILIGGAGDDRLNGGAGKDSMTGGEGDDVYVVDLATDLVNETAGGGRDTVETVLTSYTLGQHLDDLVYTGNKAFTGTGNAENNRIEGGIGADKLSGGLGDDVLVGGAGNDTLLGGDGHDDLDAGTGIDVVDGGAGMDTLLIEGNLEDYLRQRPSLTDTVLVNKATGVQITLRNIERILSSEGEWTLDELHDNLASAGNDALTGTSGDDVMDGGAGSDDMKGGAGDDRYVLDVATDKVTEEEDAGIDTVQIAFKAPGTYVLGANIEHAAVIAASTLVHLTGNALDNKLTGNAAANTLDGGLGDDILDGGAGKDVMIGGLGDDTYVVDIASDVVTELDGAGYDSVHTSLAAYTLGAQLEALKYLGTKAFAGTGNSADNRITGGVGSDKLSGGLGDDLLEGGAGNDSLLGGDGDDLLDAGTGSDTVDGGAGEDRLLVQGKLADYVRLRPNATDLVLSNRATSESITLRGVEFVVFDDGERSVAQLLADRGTGGNDILSGTDGEDVLDGGAGNDRMSGGQGDDTYIVNVAGDTVVEEQDQGLDRVEVAYTAKGAYVLPSNVEDARVTAAATLAVNLTGNALANTLTGNAAANILLGGAGADELFGGLGNDTVNGGADGDILSGGAGKDIFVFDSATGVDVVTDFASNSDKIRIAQSAYRIGDGDAVPEGALVRAVPGGFGAKAELVIFTANIVGELTAEAAAQAIGSASSAYADGAQALFVVDNGSQSTVFLFRSDGADALVSAGELSEVARLVGTPAATVADFMFSL